MRKDYTTNMLCLVLHKDDELSLVKYQKQFIKENNCPSSIFMAIYPLHIPLDVSKNNDEYSKEELKTKANLIKEITIQKPFWDLQTNKLLSKVTVNSKGGEQTVLLPLISLVQKKEAMDLKITLPLDSNIFPKTIKIFRLANKITLSANCSALTSFVWKKLT